jgi:hypothetical protein
MPGRSGTAATGGTRRRTERWAVVMLSGETGNSGEGEWVGQ